MKRPKAPPPPPKPIVIPKATSQDIDKKKKIQLQKIQSRSGRSSTNYTGGTGGSPRSASQKMGG